MSPVLLRRCCIYVVLLLGLAATASAQLRLVPYVSGLSLPVEFVQDPSSPAVQYVVQQGGLIRVVQSGVLLPTPFLDVSTAITSGGERGLLGLAFPPDYAASGRFFVNFTNLNGDTVVARFKRSAVNPMVADQTTGFALRWGGTERFITQPFPNHNGGHLAFGPDGYLYVALGDGGSGDDPDNNSQNPSTLLGKLLRIDVSVDDADPNGYRVPGDNPFVGGLPVPALPEIWAFGVRNPWKFSFDDPAHGGSGAMLIGDVGQGSYEEVDYQPPGLGGRNYGWHVREGAHPHIASAPAYAPLIDPIVEYDHSVGHSITGGFVYRGAALGAAFRGRYFFADFVDRRIFSTSLFSIGGGEAGATPPIEHTAELGGSGAIGNVSAFGVDAAGELYVVSYSSGTIFKIQKTEPTSSSLVVDLGPAYGLWIRRGADEWSQLTPRTSEGLITVHDSNQDGLIVDFGPGVGLWFWERDNGIDFWFQFTPLSPTEMAGLDADGDGDSDNGVFSFPGQGVWMVDGNSGEWFKLHPYDASHLAAADLDGDGRDDVIVDFAGYGLWVFHTGSDTWEQLHTFDVSTLVTADVDGNGSKDLVIDFPGHGLWSYRAGSGWSLIHPFDVTHVAAGDLDGNGMSDLVIDFGASFGVWVLQNGTTWWQLNTLTSEGITTGDVDGNGHDEVILDFGGVGIWSYEDLGGWHQVHPFNPTSIAAGRFF